MENEQDHPMDKPLGEIHEVAVKLAYIGAHDLALVLGKAHEELSKYLVENMADESADILEDWKYGVRQDESIWMSLGNPKTGPHCQFDFPGTEKWAKLICSLPGRIRELETKIQQLEKDRSDLSWQLNSDRQGGA